MKPLCIKSAFKGGVRFVPDSLEGRFVGVFSFRPSINVPAFMLRRRPSNDKGFTLRIHPVEPYRKTDRSDRSCHPICLPGCRRFMIAGFLVQPKNIRMRAS